MELDGVDVFVSDLRAANGKVEAGARDLTRESVKRIRDNARLLAPGASGGPAAAYPRSITIATTVEPGGIEGVVGPERGGIGSLGHIFEFGSVNSPPYAHLGPAFDREAPEWLASLVDLIDGSLQ